MNVGIRFLRRLAEATIGGMNLKALVRDVPDFPKPGILFRDITPLLAHPAAFREVLARLRADAEARDAACIVGIESRGFVFGAPVAAAMGLPFVPVRKQGKLPAAHLSVEYALEYGESQLDIHADALGPGARAYIVDDLLATGGTCEAGIKLVERLGASVVGCAFVVDLPELGGRKLLERLGMQVHVLCEFEGV